MLRDGGNRKSKWWVGLGNKLKNSRNVDIIYIYIYAATTWVGLKSTSNTAIIQKHKTSNVDSKKRWVGLRKRKVSDPEKQLQGCHNRGTPLSIAGLGFISFTYLFAVHVSGVSCFPAPPDFFFHCLVSVCFSAFLTVLTGVIICFLTPHSLDPGSE